VHVSNTCASYAGCQASVLDHVFLSHFCRLMKSWVYVGQALFLSHCVARCLSKLRSIWTVGVIEKVRLMKSRNELGCAPSAVAPSLFTSEYSKSTLLRFFILPSPFLNT
jgi:hypothetical protein